jgi:hypothetical protein
LSPVRPWQHTFDPERKGGSGRHEPGRILIGELAKASELRNVAAGIYEIRNPQWRETAKAAYAKEIAKYERRLGKRQEITGTKSDGFFTKKTVTGFYVKVYDEKVFIERPQEPELSDRRAWLYRPYYRNGNYSEHARGTGVLANSLYNRDILNARVEEYAALMQDGLWHDLLSDPISITEDGQVVNGQHRLAAATQVDWSKVENDPLFLVVWNVSAKEALHADGSRRTARDEKMIATKLVA